MIAVAPVIRSQQRSPEAHFDPKVVVFQQALVDKYPIVARLAEIRVNEPNLFERIWDALKGLFTKVDPHADTRRQVEAILASLDGCRELLASGLDADAIAKKLEKELARKNPQLTPSAVADAARVIATHAKTFATNRVTNVSAPAKSQPLAIDATPFEQKHTSVDGMRIRYLDVGPKNPKGTILLVHGHQSMVEEFTDMIPTLAKEYRVVTLDLPGSGYSDHPDRKYSLEFYEDTILHFMDALKIDKAAVAGGSMGGNLSLRLGRRAPERFPAVVSWSPAGVWPKSFAYDAMAWASDHLLTGALYWPVLKVQSKHWQKDGTPGKEQGIIDNFRYRREADDPYFRRCNAQLAADQLRNSHVGLGHLNKQPTLLMAGTEDHGLEIGPRTIEFYKELPNAELEVFEGAGHSIHFERRDALLARMLRFLSAHGEDLR